MHITDGRLQRFLDLYRAADEDYEAVQHTDDRASEKARAEAFDEIAKTLGLPHHEDGFVPELRLLRDFRLTELYGEILLSEKVRVPAVVSSISDRRDPENSEYVPIFELEEEETEVDVVGEPMLINVPYWTAILAPEGEGKYDDFTKDLQAAVDYILSVSPDTTFESYIEGRGSEPEHVARFYVSADGRVIQIQPDKLCWPEPDLSPIKFGL
jgi:hypothetical protein